MKPILQITVSVILVALAIFVITTGSSIRRQSNDILMELFMYTPVGGGLRYTFVIKNDRTMISYYGRRRSESWDESRMRNFIRLFREKETITLREEDFQYISELVSTVVALEKDYNLWTRVVFSEIDVTLIHDGNIYRNLATGESNDLLDKVIRLSPMVIRWS